MTNSSYLAVSALLNFPVKLSDFKDVTNPSIARDEKDVHQRLLSRVEFPQLSYEDWRSRVLTCQEKLVAQKINYTFPFDPKYPTCFYGVESPPLVWSYQGTPAWFEPRRLAVVGSREPSKDTQQWMSSEFLKFCQSQEWVIVSGAARGVDQLAHLGALKTRSKTIAVIPAGLSKLYPFDFLRWRDAIVDTGGCVVSQFPLEAEMRKQHFHLRNRLIAALSPGLFVVEANRRSGSRMTADYALTLGRELSALPVHPMNANGLGALDLLFDGSQTIRDAEDLKMWCALLPTPPPQETAS